MAFRQNYFSVLKRSNKRLYYAVLAFAAVSLFTSLTKNEITPFYTWSMYARPVPDDTLFPFYELQYNDRQIFNIPETWRDHKRVMFYYPIIQYVQTMENRGVEPDYVKVKTKIAELHLENTAWLTKLYNTKTDLAGYPAWLKRYVQSNIGEKIDSIQVYRKWVAFENGYAVLKRSELIFRQ